MINFAKTLRSFRAAIAGLKVVSAENNFKFHVLATVVIVAAGLILQISVGEWVAVLIVTSLVLVTEIINSAIEDISDVVRDEVHLDYEATRDVRDLAAAAVLVMAFGASVVGLIIFLPKVFALALTVFGG